MFLYANRYYANVVCVVTLSNHAKAHFNCNDLEELKLNMDAITTISNDVKKICKAEGLRGFEIPKVCILESELWTPENGLLTPAMKVKRPACKAKYEMICLDLLVKIAMNEKLSPD